MTGKIAIVGLLWTGAFLVPLSVAHAVDRFEEDPIAYSTTEANNPISKLRDGLADGSIRLERDEAFGYLKAVLDYLKIPVESQLLVFSKTSLQRHPITPETPRAIYFNDDTYVGVVPGGEFVELSVADPVLGAVFYSFSKWSDGPPRIERKNDQCLQCHASSMTRDIPGHLVRSVYTDAQGQPILRAGTEVTTHNTPITKRWGGWYITGTHGALRHRANAFAVENDRGADLDVEAGANQTALDARVAIAKYLTPHSDLVAMLILEHQTQMHNLITQANYDARFALRDQAVMDAILERPREGLSESTQRRINNAAYKLVDYMLFTEEAWLTTPVQGSSAYAAVFAAQGPRDSKGRSLRDLDLKARLFRYPLSYLIYAEQFTELPRAMKDAIYLRLWNVLTGVDSLERRHYPPTPEQCRAIIEILAETLPDLPDYWVAEHGESG